MCAPAFVALLCWSMQSGTIGSLPPLFMQADEDTKKYIANLEIITSDCNHYTMVFENKEEIHSAINILKKN